MKIIRLKQIHNIFSEEKKSKKKTKIKKFKIEIDHQEKNSLVISELVSLGFEPQFKRLKVADYIVKGVAIERKTVTDFISSIKNKRLLRQLEELQQYPNRLLIIEGIYEQELYSDFPENERTGMHPNAVRGFLLSVLLKFNVPIVFTKDYEDTAKFISVLAKKEKREMPLNINKKSLNSKERAQFILEGFPGIGPKTAKKLLKEFKSLKNVFSASETELQEILGKKSEALFKLINKELS